GYNPFPLCVLGDVGLIVPPTPQNFQGMMNVNYTQTGLQYMSTNSSSNYPSYFASIAVNMKDQSVELVKILITFTTIDLSNNLLEGEIPQVIGQLDSLIGLNLSHNRITGTIPQCLGKLRNLEWLDLSWNQLRGEIPVALTNLNFLSVLNVSQNQLEGTIPTGGQFNTFQNDSYGGNAMLCGFPLSKSCSGNDYNEHTSSSTFEDEDKFGFGWKAVAVGYACGVVIGVLFGSYFFSTGKPQWLARLLGVPIPNKRVKNKKNRAHANHRRMN
ncbi:hypothetical protein PIB30_071097, partial [Stylosanthes scabra]|nr:hypothetical protein [Stylosanthes scabra]